MLQVCILNGLHKTIVSMLLIELMTVCSSFLKSGIAFYTPE